MRPSLPFRNSVPRSQMSLTLINCSTNLTSSRTHWQLAIGFKLHQPLWSKSSFWLLWLLSSSGRSTADQARQPMLLVFFLHIHFCSAVPSPLIFNFTIASMTITLNKKRSHFYHFYFFAFYFIICSLKQTSSEPPPPIMRETSNNDSSQFQIFTYLWCYDILYFNHACLL